MKKHLLCLTVDTDPDGLSGKTTNRQTLEWEGLEALQTLPERLDAIQKPSQFPVTWFVRADGQLESILGSASYLLEKYHSFWESVRKGGHELGWHPHLYRQARSQDAAVMITNPREAQDELERLWDQLEPSFHASAFRNGEGWHTTQTYNAVERLGFRCDSTAIPGRRGAQDHPMNWEGAPNHPFFPAVDDLCKASSDRALIEVPMNTWLLQAPHDARAKIRYMNPSVHPQLFANALQNWENACNSGPSHVCVWVMILHPDEVLSTASADALYSRSMTALCQNLASFAGTLQRLGQDFEWTTISDAAERWRTSQRQLIA